MNHIREKIKELRRKNNMTQENLADHLCVTYQTVSKWETGVTSPDLSVIVPLARLFKVTTDELFCFEENADRIRDEELEAQYQETWQSGDLQRRFEISEQAVKEFPGEMKWHDRLAWAQAMRSFEYTDDDKYAEEQEEAIRRFAFVIETAPEGKLRNSSIQGIVQYLTFRGRPEEAIKYAQLYPDDSPVSKADILLTCLQGTERTIHYQKTLDSAMLRLLNLIGCGSDPACDAQEQILKTMFPDENYLYYHCFFTDLYRSRARFRIKDGNYDMAVQMLHLAFDHAREYDKLIKNNTVCRFTGPFFSCIEHNVRDICKSDTTTYVEDLIETLERPAFDPLRGREDFNALLEKCKAIR